jgi:hypothetical protein
LFVSLDNKVPKVKCRTRNGTIFRGSRDATADQVFVTLRSQHSLSFVR